MPRKSRGSQAEDTDVVTARVPKKVLFAVRIAATAEDRTISKYAERALLAAVKQTTVSKDEDGDTELSAWDVAERFFEFDDAKRIVSLAEDHAHLLTQEEAQVAELILNRRPFRTKPRPKPPVVADPAALVDWDAVREEWPTLRKVAVRAAPEPKHWSVFPESKIAQHGRK
jgi:hypothetical protein